MSASDNHPPGNDTEFERHIFQTGINYAITEINATDNRTRSTAEKKLTKRDRGRLA